MPIEKVPAFEDAMPPEGEEELFRKKIKDAVVLLRDKANLEKSIDEYEKSLLFLNGVFGMVEDIHEEEWLEGLTKRELDIFTTWFRQKKGIFNIGPSDSQR